TLVVASWVEGQFTQQLAVFGDGAHVVAGDEEHHRFAAVLVADVEVPETAQVTQRDAAVVVEPVAANAVIDLGLSRGRCRLQAAVESLQWSPAVEGAVWSLLVVDGAKGVELELEVSERVGGRLLDKEELQGLVEALDLAAGLRVIRRRVDALDAQAVEL